MHPLCHRGLLIRGLVFSLVSRSQTILLIKVQTLLLLVFHIAIFKIFLWNLKKLFFSATSAGSIIIMSSEFSLLSLHHGIEKKPWDVWDFLKHFLILELFICFLQIILSVPDNYNRFIVSTFHNNFHKLHNRICSHLV